MNLQNPRSLMITGIVMMVFGAVVPFLMAIRVVESTFLLNFLSFTASVAGFLVGIIGLAVYRSMHKDE